MRVRTSNSEGVSESVGGRDYDLRTWKKISNKFETKYSPVYFGFFERQNNLELPIPLKVNFLENTFFVKLLHFCFFECVLRNDWRCVSVDFLLRPALPVPAWYPRSTPLHLGGLLARGAARILELHNPYIYGNIFSVDIESIYIFSAALNWNKYALTLYRPMCTCVTKRIRILQSRLARSKVDCKGGARRLLEVVGRRWWWEYKVAISRLKSSEKFVARFTRTCMKMHGNRACKKK